MDYDASNDLNRDPLSNQIAERLAEDIHHGVYRPGTLLPSENSLSETYDVSRPVVREALKALRAQGYVEIVSGKGAFVREINDEPLKVFFRRALSADPEALIDLLEVRKVLEAKSAALAAQKRTTEDVARLKSVLDQMAANIENFTEYSRLDVQFHIELANISRNSFLYHLTNSIRDSLLVIISELRLKRFQAELPVIQELHDDIYAAVASGDPERAVQATNVHFDDVIDRIKNYVGESAS